MLQIVVGAATGAFAGGFNSDSILVCNHIRVIGGHDCAGDVDSGVFDCNVVTDEICTSFDLYSFG